MSKALPLFAVNPAGSLSYNAPLILYTRYSEVLYFASFIQEPNNVAELHNMRIAAKRLRYTMEIFAPAFLEGSAEFLTLLADVKSCQEQIGDIHDCDVRVDQIRDYLNQHVVKKPEIRTGLSNLIEAETSTRREKYDEFIKYWNKLSKDRSFERNFVSVVFSARLGTAKPETARKNGSGKAKASTVSEQR